MGRRYVFYVGQTVGFDNGQRYERATIVDIKGDVIYLQYVDTGHIIDLTKKDLISLM